MITFSSLIHSIYFFFFGFFIRRNYDVIFYYPNHFNRGSDFENEYFKLLIKSCSENNLSYLLIEEPSLINPIRRNKNAIPFDVVYIFIVLLRKIMPVNNGFHKREHRIGRIIKKIFFRNIKLDNLITISQSMISIFRGISFQSKIFDLQHGVIYKNKHNYILNGSVNNNLSINKVFLLLFGAGFKDLLIRNDYSNFFKKNCIVIGQSIRPNIIHSEFNKNILVTLQFTIDHDNKINLKLKNDLIKFIKKSPKSYNFYLKHHPRFNNEVELDEIINLTNVKFISGSVLTCLKICSMHVTAYSTTIFEAALLGIPSVAYSDFKFKNHFINEFNYPITKNISDYEDKILYQLDSKILTKWSSNFFEFYNANKFIKAIKNES